MTIPTWFPRFSDQIVAAYEAGHLTFDDASEIFANTCGTHPGMIVMGERLESVGDAALVIGTRSPQPSRRISRPGKRAVML